MLWKKQPSIDQSNFSHAKFLIEFEKFRKKINKFPLDKHGTSVNNDALNRVVDNPHSRSGEPFLAVISPLISADTEFRFSFECFSDAIYMNIENGLSARFVWSSFKDEPDAAKQLIDLVSICSNGQLQVVLTTYKNKLVATESILWNKSNKTAEVIFFDFKYPSSIDASTDENYDHLVFKNSHLSGDVLVGDDSVLFADKHKDNPIGRKFVKNRPITPLRADVANTLTIFSNTNNKNIITASDGLPQIVKKIFNITIISTLVASVILLLLPTFVSKISGEAINIFGLANEQFAVYAYPASILGALYVHLNKSMRVSLWRPISRIAVAVFIIYASVVVADADKSLGGVYDLILSLTYMIIILTATVDIVWLFPNVLKKLIYSNKKRSKKRESNLRTFFAVEHAFASIPVSMGSYILFSSVPDESMNIAGTQWIFLLAGFIVAISQMYMAKIIYIENKPNNIFSTLMVVSLVGAIATPLLLMKDNSNNEGDMLGWILFPVFIIAQGLMSVGFIMSYSTKKINEIKKQNKRDT